MRCSRVRGELSAYIDGELPHRTRVRLERHLAGCPGCEQYRKSLCRLVETVREAGPIEPSAEFRSSTMRRIRGAVKVPRATMPVAPRWAAALVTAVVVCIVGWAVVVANRPAPPDVTDRVLLSQVELARLLDEAVLEDQPEAASSLTETGLWTVFGAAPSDEMPLTLATSYADSVGARSVAIEQMVESLSTAERTELRAALLEMAKEG